MNQDFFNSQQENEPQNEQTETTAEFSCSAVEEAQNREPTEQELAHNRLLIEKKEIKKAALAIGISFLGLNLFAAIISSVPTLIMYLMGYTQKEISLFLYNPAIMTIRQVVFSSLVFFVPFSLVFTLFGYKFGEIGGFKKPRPKTFLPYFLIGISFCSFANIATSYAGRIFEAFGIEYDVNFGENPTGFWGFVLAFVSSAVMPALAEEFACRGLVMGVLKKFGAGFAVTTSAILFGLMHGNFEQIPFAFLVGLVVGFAALKTQSIWTAVAIHAFNNFVSVFYSVVLNDVSPNIKNLSYTLFLISALLCGILGVLLLAKRKETVTFEEIKTESSAGLKYKWVFLSVPIIIFCVLSIIDACMFF